MNSSSSNALRVGVGESSSHEVSLSLPKLKAKKGYIDIFCHDSLRPFARSGDKWIPTTICSGVRYLAYPIEPPEKYPYIKAMRKKTTETTP
jgi:hypothetical protein